MSVKAAVEVLNFGDELLVGIRQNTHLQYLGEQLSRYGLPIARNAVINDEAGEIGEAFRAAWGRADLVITTGGLGPTADDLTRETIARELGETLVFDPEIESAIKSWFAVLGREMGAHHRKQCYRFGGGHVFLNGRGTAPGLVLEKEGKALVMLPGPEHELRRMFERQMLPWLQARGWLSDTEAYLQLRTCGIGESAVEERMAPIVEANPSLTMAFCVHYGIVDVRLSCRDGCLSGADLKRISHEARERLGEDFVCFGHCSLAEVVFHELRALDRTLAVAESCTGGLLGDAFTNIPGASRMFLGGVVCYSDDAKVALLDVPECLLDQHGAVSPECAVALASGVAERFTADYGLSVTGFAGPDGGNAQNPVGTIHLGYHSPVGAWCKTVQYTGGRLDVKARAVHAALDWMRRTLRRYKMEEFLSCGERD